LPPEVIKSVAPKPKIILSSITMPVEINLQGGLKEIETRVPLKFMGETHPCSGLGYSYTFDREPIVFGLHDNTIVFSVSGGLGLNVNYCPGCHDLFGKEMCVVPRVYGSCGTNGEARRKLVTQFQTSIKLNKKYLLEPSTKLNYVQLLDPCQFSFMKINVTREIESAIYNELIQQEKEIDRQISAISLRPQLIEAWDKLQEPIALNNFGFLYLRPKNIGFDEITFNKYTATTNLSLSLAPAVLSNRPLKTIKSPLPEAEVQTEEKPFALSIDVVSTYDSLNSMVNKTLRAAPVKIKQKTVYIDSVALFQVSQDTLGLKLVFSGYKKGLLYFKGVPKIDSLTQKLYITNLSYTLSTRSVLLKSAKWLYSDKILAHIQQNSTIDLLPHIDKIKETISLGLNQEISSEAKLSGKLLTFSTKKIYVGENNILVRCFMTADMKLKILIP